MLTEALINGFLTIVNLIFSPIPTGTALNLNSQAQAIASSSYWPKLGWLNNYLPIDQMVTAAGIIITTASVILLIRVGIWLWNLTPWGGSN